MEKTKEGFVTCKKVKYDKMTKEEEERSTDNIKKVLQIFEDKAIRRFQKEQKQKELNDYFDRMPKEEAIKTIKKILQLIEAVKEETDCPS